VRSFRWQSVANRIASDARIVPDNVLTDIADYVTGYTIDSALAYETARNCTIDALGCALEALEYSACTKLLGPIVPGTVVPNGAHVPGTPFVLDPVKAAGMQRTIYATSMTPEIIQPVLDIAAQNKMFTKPVDARTLIART